MVDSTDMVLADYNSIADTYAMSGFYPQSTNTRPDGNGVYAMWDIQPLKLASKFFYNDEKNAISIAENLIKLKGIEEAVILINQESVNVIVLDEALTEEKVAQIQNIIQNELSVPVENIHINSLENEK